MKFLILFLTLFMSGEKFYNFHWLQGKKGYDVKDTIIKRIKVPPGYVRVKTDFNTFGDFLRKLPLKEKGHPVHLYDGSLKSNQSAHYAVIDIDVGKSDLQQCADAVIRLYAEFLFQKGAYKKIGFKFTSGHKVLFWDYVNGKRPIVKGNKVKFVYGKKYGISYRTFRKYLKLIFMYAGSYSLSKEMKKVANIHDIKIGDVFIKGGFPGHAVIVVDMAENPKTGEKIFLLAQSFMPAQEIHILKNPNNPELSPWYSENFGKVLITPEWTFQKNSLMRFR